MLHWPASSKHIPWTILLILLFLVFVAFTFTFSFTANPILQSNAPLPWALLHNAYTTSNINNNGNADNTTLREWIQSVSETTSSASRFQPNLPYYKHPWIQFHSKGIRHPTLHARTISWDTLFQCTNNDNHDSNHNYINNPKTLGNGGGILTHLLQSPVFRSTHKSPTPFWFHPLQGTSNTCIMACTLHLQPAQMHLFKSLLAQQYRVGMDLWGLPVFVAGVTRTREDGGASLEGIPLGFEVNGTWYVYNEVRFELAVTKKAGTNKVVDRLAKVVNSRDYQVAAGQRRDADDGTTFVLVDLGAHVYSRRVPRDEFLKLPPTTCRKLIRANSTSSDGSGLNMNDKEDFIKVQPKDARGEPAMPFRSAQPLESTFSLVYEVKVTELVHPEKMHTVWHLLEPFERKLESVIRSTELIQILAWTLLLGSLSGLIWFKMWDANEQQSIKDRLIRALSQLSRLPLPFSLVSSDLPLNACVFLGLSVQLVSMVILSLALVARLYYTNLFLSTLIGSWFGHRLRLASCRTEGNEDRMIARFVLSYYSCINILLVLCFAYGYVPQDTSAQIATLGIGFLSLSVGCMFAVLVAVYSISSNSEYNAVPLNSYTVKSPSKLSFWTDFMTLTASPAYLFLGLSMLGLVLTLYTLLLPVLLLLMENSACAYHGGYALPRLGAVNMELAGSLSRYLVWFIVSCVALGVLTSLIAVESFGSLPDTSRPAWTAAMAVEGLLFLCILIGLTRFGSQAFSAPPPISLNVPGSWIDRVLSHSFPTCLFLSIIGCLLSLAPLFISASCAGNWLQADDH